MPALNPEIIKDTKSLISFYQKNPRFKTAFDRIVANNINATYKGRPVKLYVEVLKNVTSKYKQEYSQIRKIEHDTEGKVGELFNKVNPKSDFELLDKAYNAALRGKNITEFKNDDENKEIDEINEIEKSKNNKEKRQAYERREEMARVQEQPPQETPVEAIVGSSGEPSSQPSLPSISNIPRPSSIRQFISSPRTYVSNVFRGGTSAGRVAASGAGRVIGKIGLNTAIKAGAGAAAKLGASILAGAATGGIGLIVGIATTFPGVTKKLFKDAFLIVVGLIFFIFFMFAFQRGMKMNSLLPPYDVPTMGSVAPTLPAGDLDKRCNFSAFDILNANAVNDDLLKKYTDRALASGKIKTTEQKDNLLSRAKYIRDQAQAAGLNPAIFLGYWESESAFSDYSHPGVRPGMDLGCDPLNKALNTFEADVLCAIGKSPLSNSRTSQCALSKNINSDACKAISFQQTEGVKLPISTLKDFLDSYGSKVADPNNTTSDNIVKQNIVDLGLVQCTTTQPPTPSGSFNSYFCQSNPAWASLPINNSGDTMSSGGCGLTSIAMILNYFGLSSYTPKEVLTKFNQNPSWYTYAGGTNIYSALEWVKSLGFEVVDLSPDVSDLSRDIPRYLNDGYLILGSQYINSPLSHIFVVSKILPNGNVILQDPDKTCQPNLEKTITGVMNDYSNPAYGKWMYAKAIKKVR